MSKNENSRRKCQKCIIQTIIVGRIVLAQLAAHFQGLNTLGSEKKRKLYVSQEFVFISYKTRKTVKLLLFKVRQFVILAKFLLKLK